MPDQQQTDEKPLRLVPKSWTTIIFYFVVPALAFVGYYTFNRIADSLEVPEELQAYTTKELTATQIKSNAPVVSDSQPLTAEQVQAFVRAATAVQKRFSQLAGTIDSLLYGNDKTKAPSKTPSLVAVWRNTNVLRGVTLLPVWARKELVASLNADNLSWSGYMRLKERVLHATGISRTEFESAFRERYGRYFISNDTLRLLSFAPSDSLFARAAAIRLQTDIAAADSAVVLPYRKMILDDGTGTLMDVENVFEEK